MACTLTKECILPQADSDWCRWLEQGRCHIVTPNKRLGAGPLANYKAVAQACRKHGQKFFYEVCSRTRLFHGVNGAMNTCNPCTLNVTKPA